MERDARAVVGTFYADSPFSAGATATIGEAAAHHARVKRLVPGDPVRITDGAGQVGTGRISDIQRTALRVAIDSVERVDRPRPVHLRPPVADRERMLWLAEKATELGITTWQAVRFRRSTSVSPRGEGEAFRQKIHARMVSALEQSGGAWLPAVLPETTPDELHLDEESFAIVLDVGGAALSSLVNGSDSKRGALLVVGPEGGIEESELSTLLAAGCRTANLGPTTLRFETAGIAGIAVLRVGLTTNGGE